MVATEIDVRVQSAVDAQENVVAVVEDFQSKTDPKSPSIKPEETVNETADAALAVKDVEEKCGEKDTENMVEKDKEEDASAQQENSGQNVENIECEDTGVAKDEDSVVEPTPESTDETIPETEETKPAETIAENVGERDSKEEDSPSKRQKSESDAAAADLEPTSA